MSDKITTTRNTNFYEGLDQICIEGLKTSLNPQTKVFDQQILDSKWCNTRENYPTEDLTSTAICLIGINRAKLDAEVIGLDYQETLESLDKLAKNRSYLGGFGLLIWANAVCGRGIETLERESGQSVEQAVTRVSTLTTMETAWLLSGLLHEYKRTGKERLKELIEIVSRELVVNRYIENTRTVSHSGNDTSIIHGLRKWIANFADQIYSVQSLAFKKIATGDETVLSISRNIANQMIQYQGKLGQWWWHYDAKRGGSPQPYSVYSVHQHGMAPMALEALSRAGGGNFDDAISKSQNWLYDNELGCSMVDSRQPTIWRSLDYDQGSIDNSKRKIKSLLGFAGDQSTQSKYPALKLNYETRPYEWAWCLYAGAIARDVEPSLHIV